ncbi:hypothetical protein [Streptomyces anulatus]|uniref:Uncharacterized protein n=1 Tax=Streptomyces anulatus TaxID=1892 RepID=A0ABZ1ZIL9_STRAQ|nr:hypothetical protein [Streptomyces anulatus]
MTNEIFEYLGEPLTLKYSREISWDKGKDSTLENSRHAMEVLEAVCGCFIPDAVDISLDCRYASCPEIRLGEVADDPVSRILRTGPPGIVHAGVGELQTQGFPSLTVRKFDTNVLDQWLLTRLDRVAPDEDSLLTLGTLTARRGAFWVSAVSEWTGPAKALLQDEPEDAGIEVQFVEWDCQWWVLAPGPGYTGNAPVTVDVSVGDDSIEAILKIYWRPWATAESRQHQRLMSGLSGLKQGGWLDHV